LFVCCFLASKQLYAISINGGYCLSINRFMYILYILTGIACTLLLRMESMLLVSVTGHTIRILNRKIVVLEDTKMNGGIQDNEAPSTKCNHKPTNETDRLVLARNRISSSRFFQFSF
jgi:hypothetical protein